MNQFPTLNFQDFIAAEGEVLTTTSQHVAAVFGKRHHHVLRAIRDLMEKLPTDRLTNFGETLEMRENPNGGALIPSPGYCLTRTGFTLLAMRFTGKKALIFQLAYIDAFDAMAAYIKNQREGLQYRCMEKELECKDSFRRGSFHGKGLNLRKREKPLLESELKALQHLAQPSLLN